MSLVDKIKTIAITGATIAVVGVTINSYFCTDKVTTRINETLVKRYGDSDKYLVFTDKGVFENTDAWYRLKFNSSDMQGDLMKLKGKEVEIEKYGWRIGVFSMYDNIVDVKEVHSQTK